MKHRYVGEGILAALAVFLLWAALEPVVSVSLFQARDVARAAQLAAGHPIFFGPETQGGGHLPGGFFYAVLALPVLLGLGWSGQWFWMIALYAGAAGLSWAFYRKHLGRIAALITVLPLFCFPSLTEVIRDFWNPGYLPLFVVFILLGLYHSFSHGGADSARRSLVWPGVCALIGLAVQIHFTVVAFLAASITLQLLAPRWGLRRLSTKIFFGGLVLFVALLLPYWFWLIGGWSWAQPFAPNTGSETWSIPTIALERISFLEQLSSFFKKGLPPGGWLRLEIFIPLFLWWLWRRARSEEKTSVPLWARQGERIAATCSFWSLWFAIPAFFFESDQRYALVFLMCFFSQMSFAFALQKQNAQEFWQRQGGNIITAAAVLALGVSLWRKEFIYYGAVVPGIFVVFIALIIFLFVTREKITPRKTQWILATGLFVGLSMSHLFSPTNITQKTIEGVCKYIQESTPWTYPEARSRTFFIGTLWPFVSVESVCSSQGRGAEAEKKTTEAMDGLFIVHANPPEIYSRGEFWVGAVNETLARALKSGAVKLGTPVVFDSAFVVPYQTVDAQDIPAHFQNSGGKYEPYHLHSYSEEIRALSPNPYPYRFLFNNSPRQLAVNDSAILARVRDDRTLDIKILGRPLSEPLIYAAPGWREALSRPYVEVECKGQKAKIIIAETVGATGYDNRDFLAPFERSFPWPCTGAAESLTLGYEASSYGRAGDVVGLPGQKVTIALRSAE